MIRKYYGLIKGPLNKPWEYEVEPPSLGTVKRIVEIIESQIKIDRAHSKMLDFGCGNGRYLKAFEAFFLKENLYGCDLISNKMNDLAASNDQIKTLSSEKSQLPYSDSFFDIVFSSNVIEHIPKKAYFEYLNEIHRVLKVGGVFYIGAPNYPVKRIYDILTLHKKPDKYKKYFLFDDPTHINKRFMFNVERDLKVFFENLNLMPSELFFESKISFLKNKKIRSLLRFFGYKYSGYCINKA